MRARNRGGLGSRCGIHRRGRSGSWRWSRAPPGRCWTCGGLSSGAGGRSCDWIRRRWFLFGQLCHRQLHRMLDWDPGDAFCLIDPRIGRQGRQVFLLRVRQLFRSRLGAFHFVIIPPRRSANDHQRKQPEKGEEKHHPDPGREHGTRLMILDGFFLGHGQFTVWSDSSRRGSRFGKREVLRAMRR